MSITTVYNNNYQLLSREEFSHVDSITNLSCCKALKIRQKEVQAAQFSC